MAQVYLNRGALVGGLVSAGFGLLWVFVNAGGLPAPADMAARGIGVGLFVAVLWLATRQPPTLAHEPTPPGARTWRTYRISVIAMLALFLLGSTALNRLERPELVPLWVLLVVGAHFWPFAAAFGEPVFRTLSLGIAALAVAGAIGVLAGWPEASAVATVLAGLTLLGFALKALLTRAAQE